MLRIGLASLGFVGAVAAANYATQTWGFVPVPFGLEATAGTYFAGVCFVLRDTLSDLGGRRLVVALILVGAALSFVLSSPALAVASGVAFLVSELADWSIYEPLRGRGYVRAALASNTAGAVVDTFLFLWLAGFPILEAVPGQLVGKLTVTAIVVGGVLSYRAVSSKPVRVG